MPSHFITEIKVSGPASDILAFSIKHILKPGFEDNPDAFRFDLGTVIPRPACIEGTESSSNVADGIDAYHKNPTEWMKFVADKWGSDSVAKVRKSLEAFKECGHYNWYTWSNANWGTKWNSYRFDWVGKQTTKTLKFKFETAWAPPMPVLRKLVEMWPTLKFSMRGRDEFESKWALLV